MKLKNKETGEIIDFYKGEITLHCNQGRKTIHFKHLEDLEKWEDYEEPKEYWFINDLDGKPMKCELRYCPVRDFTEWSEKRKQIGNYFETKEKAEEVVEKLKALQRLKDKGFRFEGRSKPNYGEKFIIECSLPIETLVIDVVEDLDLLFSGGEE